MKIKIERLPVIFSKLTKEQKKIIGFFIVSLIFLFFFWLFVYKPQKIRSSKIEKELLWTEGQILEIKRLTEGRDLSEAIGELKMDFLNKAKMMPEQDQTVVAALLEAAKNSRVEVKNISPSPKSEIKVDLPGYIVEELPISLKIISEYKSLGDYIYLLRKDFPVLVEIDKLDIKGRGEGEHLLDAELKITAYLSRKK